MRIENPFGIGKPPTSGEINRVIVSSEMPVKTKPLTPEQIAEGMRRLGDKFDLFQQLAEALKRN